MNSIGVSVAVSGAVFFLLQVVGLTWYWALLIALVLMAAVPSQERRKGRGVETNLGQSAATSNCSAQGVRR